MRATFLAMILLIIAGKVFAACAPDAVALHGDQGTEHFAVEIALSPSEREHGLMDWRKMAADAGMLFVFDPPVHAVFSMKDT